MTKKFSSWSFKRVFFVAIMLTVVSHYILTDLLTLAQLENKMMVDIKRENDVTVEALGDMLTRFFAMPVNELLTFSKALKHQSSSSEAFSTAIDILGASNSFSRISLVNAKGRIESTCPVDSYYLGLDLSHNGYLNQLKNGDDYYWSNTYNEPVTGKSNIDLIVPYKDGYVMGTIDLTKLQAYISQLHIRAGSMVTIVDQGGSYLAHSSPDKVEQRMKDPYLLKKQVSGRTPLTTGQSDTEPTLSIDGVTYYPFSTEVSGTHWHIVAYYEKLNYEAPIRDILKNIILTQITSLMIAIGILVLIGRYFQNQIEHIMEYIRKISEGDYTVKHSDSHFSEFRELLLRFGNMATEIGGREEEIRELNNTLEEKIIERTQQLTDANDQLENSMNILKATQDQLLQKEKMESLNVLISGIAHKINTPVGVCLTTATYLTKQEEIVRQSFESGQLTPSELSDFLNTLDESGQMLNNNLQRAAELINMFKQMSLSPSIFSMQELDIVMYTRLLVEKAMARYPQVEMTMFCERKDMTIICYPKDIDIIMDNLITNAITHGYDGKSDLKIDVQIKPHLEGCLLTVSDTGKGIEESEISRIFDPFYTNKHGSGGSGLGLHIVYNLIVQRYQGTIVCKSTPRIGTAFELYFPNLV